MLLARKAVAMPMELAMKLRRSMPNFFALSSAMRPMRYSTSFCLLFCGRGMNSSLETTCVGMGESTPFLRSRCHLGIHIGKLLDRTGLLTESRSLGGSTSPRRLPPVGQAGPIHAAVDNRRYYP